MIAFAARYFEINSIETDGKTYREIIEGLIERSINRSEPSEKRAGLELELELPQFPVALDYLWNVFWRLSNRRGSNGFGPNPISWPDIDAFTRHSKFYLAPWEVEIIEAMDNLYRADRSKPKSTDSKEMKEK